MKTLRTAVWLLFSLGCLAGCRTVTLRCPKEFGTCVTDTVTVVETVQPVMDATTAVGDTSVKELPLTSSAETLELDTLPPVAKGYQWLSYRGKADVTDPEGTRTCNFYMVNRVDSILYLNLHASGIEFIRVVCTPDSIIYVNKLKYEYYQGTYEPFRKLTGLPVDFELIQSIFNGNVSPENEAALRYKGLEAEPKEYVALDSTQSFFTELVLRDLNRLIEIDAVMKLVRLDVPGPTSIRIPDKFKEIKMP
ncbi:MAG: DUF4292 domain-containing protein [Bacteroidales bacterium]|nr:DUF4292 domain-containing protein [Bacteroidales bacterium]